MLLKCKAKLRQTRGSFCILYLEQQTENKEDIMAILEVSNVKKIYTTRFGGNQVQALSDVSFSVEKGEYVAIMGESGSGKTTLLNILAALDKATSGLVLLNGKNLSTIREAEVSQFRRENLGFVFQDFMLLDGLTVFENICLPHTVIIRPLKNRYTRNASHKI